MSSNRYNEVFIIKSVIIEVYAYLALVKSYLRGRLEFYISSPMFVSNNNLFLV